MTDVSTTCAVVIFRVKVSCITSEKKNMFNPFYSPSSLSIRASFGVTNTFFLNFELIFLFHLIWWQLPELQIWWNSWYWAPWFNFRNLLCSGIVQQNTHKHDGRPSERLVPITGLSYLSLVPRSAPWLMLVKSQRVCRSPAGLFNYIASNLSIAYCMIICVECQWTSKTRC